MSILEAQVTFLPRAITQVILAQNQSPGPVWNAKTYTNLPVLIEKAPLILNALKSKLNKMAQFIGSLLYVISVLGIIYIHGFNMLSPTPNNQDDVNSRNEGT